MSLLNKINGGMIERLASSSSSGTNTSKISGSINGQGKGVSVAAAQVDVGNALSLMSTSFRDSFLRMDSAIQKFAKTSSALGHLSSTLKDLIELAQRSVDPETQDVERARLNSDFQKKVADYRSELQAATHYDPATGLSEDFLSTTDLEQALQDAGINPSAATSLAQAFARVGNGDTQVGDSPIQSEDATVGNDDGTTSSAIASNGTDALDQDISSRAQAAMAVGALTKLKDDVDSDTKNVTSVLEELRGARSFALSAYAATVTLVGQLSPDDASTTALKLVSLIQQTSSGDASLSAHSDIDAQLAKELLGSSTSSSSSSSSSTSSASSTGQ